MLWGCCVGWTSQTFTKTYIASCLFVFFLFCSPFLHERLQLPRSSSSLTNFALQQPLTFMWSTGATKTETVRASPPAKLLLWVYFTHDGFPQNILKTAVFKMPSSGGTINRRHVGLWKACPLCLSLKGLKSFFPTFLIKVTRSHINTMISTIIKNII